MNKKDEALKLALDANTALRKWVSAVPKDTPLPAMPGIDGDWLDEVDAIIREALASEAYDHIRDATKMIEQPAQQEPEYITNDGSFTDSELTLTNALIAVQHYCQAWVYAAFERDIGQHALALERIKELEQPAQQQQWPYGWKVYGVNSLFMDEFAEADAKAEAKRIGGTCIAFPLYTSPQASKPWVGLTDEEIATLADMSDGTVCWMISEIEAKLRERNEHKEKNHG